MFKVNFYYDINDKSDVLDWLIELSSKKSKDARRINNMAKKIKTFDDFMNDSRYVTKNDKREIDFQVDLISKRSLWSRSRLLVPRRLP